MYITEIFQGSCIYHFMSNEKQIMHPQEIDYSTLLLGPGGSRGPRSSFPNMEHLRYHLEILISLPPLLPSVQHSFSLYS